MTTSHRPGRATRRVFAALGAACALLPSLWMWGFTVDDALIPVRYAHNLAQGAGYRFDALGPSTDGVTPLPWAFLLAPLARGDALTTLRWAKALGVVAWTVAGAILGARVGATLALAPASRRLLHAALAALGLVVMGLAFPIGAWAASGMETGLATALATVAATRLGRPRQAALLAGAVGALRPEMVVWAAALAVGAAALAGADRNGRTREGAIAAAIATAPFLACAAVRGVAFGRLAPLAVLAKPSDLSHGAIYAAAALVVVLTPILVLAPVALVRGKEAGAARVLVLAFLAHLLVVMAVGGDWMPYARFLVPVAPSLVLAFAELGRGAERAGTLWSAGRAGVALALGSLLAARAAPAGRGVQADRDALVARATPILADAKVVAALDVGWVSASTTARVVDLAGLTDPSIALLSGGHTSKRVDVAMLLDRGVDVVILYSESRVVELRIARSELFDARFEPRETLPLGSRGAFYTVYRRR